MTTATEPTTPTAKGILVTEKAIAKVRSAKSFIYLHGMTLDYQETLMQQGFVFVNPQASKSCGCGTSFSA